MPIKATAVIRKEPTFDQKTRVKSSHPSLSLLSESGRAYGLPRYFGSFEEAGALLKTVAGVTHEQLQDRYQRYQNGEEVRISLNLENEKAIADLGFDPKA